MTRDSAKSGWWRAPGWHWWNAPGARRAFLAAVAAIPVVMVNGTAFIGQFAFIRTHVPWILPGQVLFASTLEVVAVYIAFHAHVAMMKNDSAARLKAGAYSLAAVIGAMNYTHYMAAHWRPTVMAVGMFLMSTLSPWLWGIHTRRASRDQLMEKGLVEEHSVRLGATRWTWHPWRSMRVMNWATWHGVSDPARAIGAFAGWYGTADTALVCRASGWRATWARATAEASQELARADDHWIAPLAQAAGVPVDGTRAVVHAPEGEPQLPARQEDAPAAPGEGSAPEVTAKAVLRAEPAVSPPRDKRPAQDVIDAVELSLAALPDDKLPSKRAVARWLSPDSDQRRLAERLLAQRAAAGRLEPGASQEEEGPRARRQGTVPGMIAPPRGFQPGGNGTHG